MTDTFSGHAAGLESPAANASTIAPSDFTDLPDATRAIYVGTGGALSVELVSGDVIDLSNVQTGMIYPLRVRKVRSSGTTATGLVGLW